MTTTVAHDGLTHLFTQVCHDKTDWDMAPMLYVIERDRNDIGGYYLTPMSIISNDMLTIASDTGLPFPVILDRYADVMEATHEVRPDLNPAGKHLDFIGLAYSSEVFKTKTDDDGNTIDQPAHSNDLADNPHSIEIFAVAAYTIDGYIHSHVIERVSRDHDHCVEPMTEKHEVARVPVTLRRMVNIFSDASDQRAAT